MENVFKKNFLKYLFNIFVDIIFCFMIFFLFICFYMNDKYWIVCVFMCLFLFEKVVISLIKLVFVKDDKGWIWILIYEFL